MNCEHCLYHNDWRKFDYHPLWFAWHPIKTDEGIVFMTHVHKIPHMTTRGNMLYTWPSIDYTYAKHKEKDMFKEIVRHNEYKDNSGLTDVKGIETEIDKL